MKLSVKSCKLMGHKYRPIRGGEKCVKCGDTITLPIKIWSNSSSYVFKNIEDLMNCYDKLKREFMGYEKLSEKDKAELKEKSHCGYYRTKEVVENDTSC